MYMYILSLSLSLSLSPPSLSQPHSTSHTMGVHGAITKSEAAVKAFSGRGQTLGTRQEKADKVIQLNN